MTYNDTVTKLKIHVFINLSTGILGTTWLLLLLGDCCSKEENK